MKWKKCGSVTFVHKILVLRDNASPSLNEKSRGFFWGGGFHGRNLSLTTDRFCFFMAS